MTQAHLARLSALMDTVEYREALQAAFKAEAADKIEQLRNTVRMGNTHLATQIVAQIDAYEDAVEMLDRYAKQYRKEIIANG